MTDLKGKLRANQITVGTWITIAHPVVAEIIARVGFDWLVIDVEHTSVTTREAEDLIRVVDLCGSTPLVRLTSNNVDQIKRMMDCGAHGVVVPMVNSKEEAEKAVASVYYPPKGKRGVGLARAQGYGARFQEYRGWIAQSPVVIVQIEHIDSVRNLESILSVEGVDGYIVGPYDLSASLGVPGDFDHPDVIAALAEIKEVAATVKKPGGYHIVEPDLRLAQQRIREGYKFLAFGSDIRVLDTMFRSSLATIRQESQGLK